MYLTIHKFGSLVKRGSSQNLWSVKDENDGVQEKRENELPAKNELQGEMDAESADKFLRPLENFVGVFSPKLLQSIKIVSYPASILVLTDGHWISLYLTNKTLEIMDSMGYLANDDISTNLENFITAHATAKQISTTPQIQTTDSELCSLYAITFLYFRTFECGTLCDFCKLFRPNLSLNSKIILRLFNTIRKINKTN